MCENQGNSLNKLFIEKSTPLAPMPNGIFIIGTAISPLRAVGGMLGSTSLNAPR